MTLLLRLGWAADHSIILSDGSVKEFSCGTNLIGSDEMLPVHIGFAAGAAEFFATDADKFNLQEEPRLARSHLEGMRFTAA